MSAFPPPSGRRPASARSTTALLLALLGAASLAGCTVNTAEPSPPPPAPTVETAPVEETDPAPAPARLPEACASSPARADLGSRDGANGEVYEEDANGLATVYAVAYNDTFQDIAGRFCLDKDELRLTYNHGDELIADEYIALQPESRADARRASGYNFPACPVSTNDNPLVASISWWADDESDKTYQANVQGTPRDTGAARGATGDVRTDSAGDLIDYTVASNDTWRGIRDRFCFDYYFMWSLTGTDEPSVLHPGDVIPLKPQFLERPVD
ncbi:hypothetical protein [Microbacterium aquilitoris]|uniref:hypothetical protein n=1 Tax=Microbacterium aquilitoris TaxID=3067307 RepID=UPI00288EDC67|nr:hypothetical protein [Microbacterium sp. KSW2-22]MDT3344495.1 hypothetical protein [Microbacterium sp. KSW2-22]